MRKILQLIGFVTRYTGEVASWFCYALILVVVYDVTMRYVFSTPTQWAFETTYMIGATIFVLGFAYAHLHRSHVRVDILYLLLSPRGRGIIDVVGTLFLFFPLLAMLIHASFLQLRRSWLIGEKSAVTIWYPPITPLKTVILIAFCLLAFQAVAHFIRDLYFLIRNKPYD